LFCYEQTIVPRKSRFEALPSSNCLLPYGNGRSYGDVCLNERGTLIATRGMDHMIAFDPVTGILECESGVLLSEVIELMLSRGWFPPVCPGTALVTVGGAIANDVHGKNHHRLGSFGHHVLSLELLRSDGRVLRCSAEQNADWFRATIGGLGLTGLILTARLRLRRVAGPYIEGNSQRFRNLEEFFRLSAESERGYEYTVAWLDCAATGRKLGRGVFICGNHAAEPEGKASRRIRPPRDVSVALTPPVSPVFGASVRALSTLVYHRPSSQRANARWHYQQFQFPLDGVKNWNRLYGPRGFLQYQCVLPCNDAHAALKDILQRIARAQQGSFLSVLKTFGAMPSLGMMSFPRPGPTLALDFPNRGTRTLQLLESLDEVTRQVGGAVYPAKDARMSGGSFRQYYPAWRDFSRYIDPNFSSSFWRRVTDRTT
jgi:FAD/FMN-containing dehydrogenase